MARELDGVGDADYVDAQGFESGFGGDFGVLLASVDVGDEAEAEWVEVVKRHRLMAGRLESIVGAKDRHTPELPTEA